MSRLQSDTVQAPVPALSETMPRKRRLLDVVVVRRTVPGPIATATSTADRDGPSTHELCFALAIGRCSPSVRKNESSSD